jgi:hypothetical protein
MPKGVAESICEPEIKRKKITLVPFADMHTGGTTALHPNKRRIRGNYERLEDIGGWSYSDRPNFQLDSRQLEIWKHFEKCLDWAAELRKDTQLVLVSDGDALEGNHHNTPQLVTIDEAEMMDTHEELMLYIQDRLGFDRGDSLYYVFGTEAHTRNHENLIAQRLNAYQYPNGRYCSNFLELHLNGVKIWIYHHGVTAGDYPTRGEQLTRHLKRIWYKCKLEGVTPPDLILTAHTHDAIYSTYTQDWKTIHGIILPSWQDKTRLCLDKLPLSTNKIGLQIIQISENGEILPIKAPMLMERSNVDVVNIGY